MKTFVIAGTATEARHWIDSNIRKRYAAGQTSVSLSDYVTVTSSTTLRGIVDPHGVFVGSWKERWDLEEIVETLFMCSHSVNRELQKIRDDVRALNRKKPQPKLHPVSGGWAIGQTVDAVQAVSYQDLVPTMIKAIQELNDKVEELKDARTLPTP